VSDTSMGPGWWQASDGKWYPPRESDEAPEAGWWLAADGKWYPPSEAESPPEPGWWLAADGKWYPPLDTDLVTEPDRVTASGPPEPAPVVAASLLESALEPVAVTPAPAPRPTAPAAASAPRNGTNGSAVPERATDASEQIRRRNQASRDDAVTQFPARFLAAARAVQLLESELALSGAEPAAHSPKKHERKGRARAEAMAAEAKAKGAASRRDESGTDGTRADGSRADGSGADLTEAVTEPAEPVGDFTVDPAPAAVEPPTPPPEPPPEPPRVPVGRPTTRPGEAEGWPAPRPMQPAHPHAGPRVGEPGGPLIELRPSPLGADIDHLGERLLVFEDRVELRGRADRVLQAVAASDIAEAGVQRKFTGAVLTIAGLHAEPIVVKGLKPEQADEVVRLIQTRLRHPNGGTAPEAATADDAPAADAPPEESVLAAPSPDAVANAADRLAILNRSRLNEADLLRKLADLHRAGVLSDAEFAEKIALVGRLVSGETVVVV
jgi:hypothetical protein